MKGFMLLSGIMFAISPTAEALGLRQEGGKTPQVTLELVLVAIVVLIVVGRRLLLISHERQAGGAAGYGAAGGAICPGCGRPFARYFLSPNLMVGKLCRCPHCGKWSIVPRATPAELAAAEATSQTAPEPTAPALSEEERLRRQIESSKFE